MQPKIISGDMAIDDRGKLSFVNGFDFKKVKRFYVVENFADGPRIRGWHGHMKEEKYALVTKGLAMFLVSSMETSKKYMFALSADKPEILHIPGGYFHAFKTRTKKNQVIFFSTATLEESKADDYREVFTANDLKLFNSVIR